MKPAEQAQLDRRPKIEGKLLTDNDIGRSVVYLHHGLDGRIGREYGKLIGFRVDGAVFVQFKGPNGERCPAASLRWAL